MGKRNKDRTLGHLCIEKVIDEEPGAPHVILTRK